MNKCETCKYFVPVIVIHSFCARHAPEWPEIDKNNWCGDWEPKSEEERFCGTCRYYYDLCFMAKSRLEACEKWEPQSEKSVINWDEVWKEYDKYAKEKWNIVAGKVRCPQTCAKIEEFVEAQLK